MSAATVVVSVRPCAVNAICEAPSCHEPAKVTMRFENAETPGLDSLNVCERHGAETWRNYEARS